MTGNSRRAFNEDDTFMTENGEEDMRSRTETVSVYHDDEAQKSGGRKSVKFAMDRSVKFKEDDMEERVE